MTESQRTVCEAFGILGCDNGYTACKEESLIKAITNDMAPYRQGGLVDDYGNIKEDKFKEALNFLIKNYHVIKKEIKGTTHYTLDKESWYPG